MRILFLSQLIPYPPDAGAKVRSFHVIQHLVEAGHEVTLVAFQRSGDRPEYISHLNRICAGVHTVPMRRSRLKDVWHFGRSLVNGEPFLIARDHVGHMHERIRQLVTQQDFDAIHADQLWMAQYALAAKAHIQGRGNAVKLILDQHNAMYLIPERLAAGRSNWLKRAVLVQEARKMERYEVATCRQFDHVVWVTDEDRSAFDEEALGKAEQLTIPICVNVASKVRIACQPEARRITFLGGLHWPPNADGVVWFAREVWPRVLSEVPDAILTIIGKNPPLELQSQSDPIPALDVTGFVDDLDQYLAETAVFIVPLHAGGGMRVKIVDAWSWGLPVVSTTIGAEGIKARNGHNLLVGDDAETFAEAVIRLLKDRKLAGELSEAGRRTVESEYDWGKIYSAWDRIYGAHHNGV